MDVVGTKLHLVIPLYAFLLEYSASNPVKEVRTRCGHTIVDPVKGGFIVKRGLFRIHGLVTTRGKSVKCTI